MTSSRISGAAEEPIAVQFAGRDGALPPSAPHRAAPSQAGEEHHVKAHESARFNAGGDIAARFPYLTAKCTTAEKPAKLWSHRNVRFDGIFFLALLCVALVISCSSGPGRTVVVYTSQDQVYAEPILRQFTAETGINVLPVFDSEAVKTVGLVNRLLAERHRPQCDVFWNNEALRTHQLATKDVFRTDIAWQTVGYRSRRIVINTNRVSGSIAPRTLTALTNSAWREKIALAYPLFGTTATHFLALRQSWGNDAWESWCRALQANRPLVVDGNSVVVKLIGRGEAWVGLTDSDDIAAGVREGLPIDAMPLSEESLLIPNTVAIVRNAPHPAEAEELFNYLQRPAVAKQLIAVHALEGKSFSEADARTLEPDYAAMVRDLELASGKLKEIFLR